MGECPFIVDIVAQFDLTPLRETQFEENFQHQVLPYLRGVIG